MTARKSRPADNRAAQSNSAATFKLDMSVAARDVLARVKRHDFAVRVVFERADGVVCSQIYASLDAAERRVRRCHERNLAASMCLVRLVPVASAIEVGDRL